MWPKENWGDLGCAVNTFKMPHVLTLWNNKTFITLYTNNEDYLHVEYFQFHENAKICWLYT